MANALPAEPSPWSQIYIKRHKGGEGAGLTHLYLWHFLWEGSSVPDLSYRITGELWGPGSYELPLPESPDILLDRVSEGNRLPVSQRPYVERRETLAAKKGKNNCDSMVVVCEQQTPPLPLCPGVKLSRLPETPPRGNPLSRCKSRTWPSLPLPLPTPPPPQSPLWMTYLDCRQHWPQRKLEKPWEPCQSPLFTPHTHASHLLWRSWVTHPVYTVHWSLSSCLL